VLSCGEFGGGDRVVAHEEHKSFTFTVPPKNSKPSSALNATSQWSTSVASVDIGCIGRHWLHRSTLVTPTPTPPLPPLRAAQLFREAIA
jgi:hypothetical protein